MKVSFFGLPGVPRLRPPWVAPDNGLRVASLLDLAGMKASVVQMRAEAKDYVDIDAMLSDGRVDLPSALASARAIYGAQFNPQVTLKALSYFEDGDLPRLPRPLRDRLARAVAVVDLDHLPIVTHRREMEREAASAQRRNARLRAQTHRLVRTAGEGAGTTKRASWPQRIVYVCEGRRRERAEFASRPARFLAYAFARATHEEISASRRYVDDADLREALDVAPPGVIDPRSGPIGISA